MNITIIAVGKQHQPHIQTAIQLYQSRLQQFCRLSWIFLPHAGKSTPELAKKAESEAIRSHVKPDDTIILLDERGQQYSSPELAKQVNKWQTNVRGRLVFIIGGAYGVNETLRHQANQVWSLSQLVFPHQLVRVLLLEQLYRAYAILHHLPYHHE